MARVLVLLMGIVVVACATGPGPSRHSPHRFDPWQQIAPERAGIRFTGSEAPAGLAARQRIGHDGVRIVELVLTNDTLDVGENKVLVASRERSDQRPLSLDEELITFDFDRSTVESHFTLLLRGARRTTEPRRGRNRYGPYQYVAAEYPAGSQCVYAWQHVEGDASSFSRRVFDASIQYRFCDQRRSPEQLIEVFDGIDLDL